MSVPYTLTELDTETKVNMEYKIIILVIYQLIEMSCLCQMPVLCMLCFDREGSLLTMFHCAIELAQMFVSFFQIF